MTCFLTNPLRSCGQSLKAHRILGSVTLGQGSGHWALSELEGTSEVSQVTLLENWARTEAVAAQSHARASNPPCPGPE